MESKQFHKTKEFLQSDLFYDSQISVDKIIEQIQASNTIRIMYGETYDGYGITIDSLKYYLILEYIARLIKNTGINIESVLLVGDTASIRNENVTNKEGLLETIRQNVGFIQQIKKKYHFSFEIKIMSQVFQDDNFETKLKNISDFVKQNIEIQNLLEKTILQNRLKQEMESGFKYALEEIAIISDYDLKLGPPREQYYDKVAQIYMNGNPLGIYVKPTYPLGLNYDYFINHPEIEEFGLTPYKAGSNKLQQNRFVLNNTSRSQLQRFIKTSFISKHPELPNPLKDLYDICQLSKAIRTDSELDLSFNEDSVDHLTNLLIEEFNEYITE